MTVRDATRRESPDGHVLYIEDLRKHFGIRSGAGAGSSSEDTPKTCPEVILIGHDMHGDFLNINRDDIDLQTAFHYSGCLDTAVIIEDTSTYMGKSLSSLVSSYSLAELEWKNPGCPKIPGKYTFTGSHCAGNDAIKTLEASLALALDLNIKTRGRNSENQSNLTTDWLDKPLQDMNTSMILLAYDTETVETPRYKPQVLNRTSEHGFASLRIADVADVAPGKNARNWRPFIRASHWINQDFHNFKNRFYCVGNPLGFWPEYGKSQLYHVREGPAVFHRMFLEIATFSAGSGGEGDDSIGGVTELLEKTTLVGRSADNEDDLKDGKGKHPFSRDVPWRGRGGFRGNSGRGNQGRIDDRGGTRGDRGNSAGGRGNSSGSFRGNWRGNYNVGGNVDIMGNSVDETGDFRGSSSRGSRYSRGNRGGHSNHR